MQKSFVFIAIILSLFFFHPTIVISGENYFTDAQELPRNQRELYKKSRSTLNDWTGELEKLSQAHKMINSFIKIEPNFLPIYIEQARYTLMMGHIGNNDINKYNLDALEIIKKIQKKAPKYAKSYVLAGHIYTNRQDYEKASAALTTAENIGIIDPWLHNNWASLLKAQGYYEEAIEHAIKAIEISGENGKALVAAIWLLRPLLSLAHSNTNDIDVIDPIFKNINDPIKRLRIAERLIDSYRGRGSILSDAYQVIIRQKQETPQLIACDIEMAYLILRNGYKFSNASIRSFTKESRETAENILLALPQNEKISDRVFDMLIEIALDDKDYLKASTLVKEGGGNGVTENRLKLAQASIYYLTRRYEQTIDIFNELLESDVSFSDHVMFLSAYEKLGQPEKLEEYFVIQLNRDPEYAWAYGNYASFLLFTKNDSQSAIQYGNIALSKMMYPNARNVTGLAYQIEASKKIS